MLRHLSSQRVSGRMETCIIVVRGVEYILKSVVEGEATGPLSHLANIIVEEFGNHIAYRHVSSLDSAVSASYEVTFTVKHKE